MLLDNDDLDLKDERVNQIKGAIDEIELFLMTLHHYQEKEIKRNYNTNGITLPSQNKGIFNRVTELFKKENLKPRSSNFSLSDSYKNQSLKPNKTEV